MKEYEKHPFEDEKQPYIVKLGEPFLPFENGFTNEVDPLLDKINDAVGYSQSFFLDGFGRGRVELYNDTTNRIPANQLASLDPQVYEMYTFIPTLAFPVILYDDPESVKGNLICYLSFAGEEYFSVNLVESKKDDLAMFNEWYLDPFMQRAYIGFMNQEALESMQLRFELLDDNEEVRKWITSEW